MYVNYFGEVEELSPHLCEPNWTRRGGLLGKSYKTVRGPVFLFFCVSGFTSTNNFKTVDEVPWSPNWKSTDYTDADRCITPTPVVIDEAGNYGSYWIMDLGVNSGRYKINKIEIVGGVRQSHDDRCDSRLRGQNNERHQRCRQLHRQSRLDHRPHRGHGCQPI